jgi:hypothetical protein
MEVRGTAKGNGIGGLEEESRRGAAPSLVADARAAIVRVDGLEKALEVSG